MADVRADSALTHPHWNSTASPLNPRSDHMMYVDSIYAKTFSEVATLVSPMTTVPMSGCLSFQYQRSESSSNLFVVYARDQLGQYQELWRADRETQSGAFVEWTPAQVDLKAPYSVQVSRSGSGLLYHFKDLCDEFDIKRN